MRIWLTSILLLFAFRSFGFSLEGLPHKVYKKIEKTQKSEFSFLLLQKGYGLSYHKNKFARLQKVLLCHSNGNNLFVEVYFCHYKRVIKKCRYKLKDDFARFIEQNYSELEKEAQNRNTYNTVDKIIKNNDGTYTETTISHYGRYIEGYFKVKDKTVNYQFVMVDIDKTNLSKTPMFNELISYLCFSCKECEKHKT